ncbi:MAG TPA: glycosyltransferase family 4 protein [Puia sp.]
MEKIKLNICAIEDPTNPRTWSGTPHHIYSILKKTDRLNLAFSTKAVQNKYLAKFFTIISKLYYNNSADVQRGFIIRALSAKKADSHTAGSGSNLTLHMGTLDLPFDKLPEKQKHFLFCDYTWQLWSTSATNRQKYTKRLLSDAEKLEKKAYQQIEHIFSISEYVKQNLIEHYKVDPDKITVVGTGLGIIKPFFGEKDYANGKILFAAKGRFEDKGGPLVLKAFEIALKTNPRLELAIVGQNDYTQKINLPNVKTYGFIPIDELQDIFNRSSLFLMPATNEPWGLVYLEALACKIPIVGLNRNSFPELSGYGKYGFGLDNADAEDLAKLILKAFDEPERLADMGEKAQEHCLNNFTWEHTVNKIIQTLENSSK